MNISHFILPHSLYEQMARGVYAGQETFDLIKKAMDAVMLLSAEGEGVPIENHSYATLVNRGNGEPITLCGLPIFVSRAMPSNVAFYLLSHTSNSRGLSVSGIMVTWKGEVTHFAHTFTLTESTTVKDTPETTFKS